MIKKIKQFKKELKSEEPHFYYQFKSLIYVSTIVAVMTHVSFSSWGLTIAVAGGLYTGIVAVILDV